MVQHLNFLKSGGEGNPKDNLGLDIKSFAFSKPLPTTADMISYTRENFNDLLDQLNIKNLRADYIEGMYQDRLAFLRGLYTGNLSEMIRYIPQESERELQLKSAIQAQNSPKA